MSTPDNNWEVRWQETMDQHEASPPSATDWAGMEQLLDAKVVALPSKPAAGPFPSLSSLPWFVWAIALISLLALGYWLGTRSAGDLGHEELVVPNTQVSTNTTGTIPTSPNLTDSPLGPSTNGKQNKEVPSFEQKATGTQISNSLPAPGPATNTPNTTGGPSNVAPPAFLAPAEQDADPNLVPIPTPVEETDSMYQNDFPSFSFPGDSPPKRQKANRKYQRIRPLKTLTLPTDYERWGHRVDQLLQSEKLTPLPPNRVNNGHFPAYRIRN